MDVYQITIAIVGSAIAGAINTLAGNGSAITLTILTEVLGLPGNIANGTNRIGIVAQSATSIFEFQRGGKFNLKRSWRYILPTFIGAIAGALVAIYVSNEAFRKVFGFMMVFMLFVILFKPKRWLRETDTSSKPSMWIVIPAFLAMGFYGGFIQMGMGIFFLAILVLGARFSLMESNAIKILTVGLYTVFVIILFEWKGLIDWKIGGIMAIGQAFGGWITARYASRYPGADKVAYWLLVVIVVWAAARILGVTDWLLAIGH
ncbi:MAG: sulfite exporter TauE/SafE family protein [Saprospiraceae bacterium]